MCPSAHPPVHTLGTRHGEPGRRDNRGTLDSPPAHDVFFLNVGDRVILRRGFAKGNAMFRVRGNFAMTVRGSSVDGAVWDSESKRGR